MQYPPTYLNKVPKLMKANPEEKPAKGDSYRRSLRHSVSLCN